MEEASCLCYGCMKPIEPTVEEGNRIVVAFGTGALHSGIYKLTSPLLKQTPAKLAKEVENLRLTIPDTFACVSDRKFFATLRQSDRPIGFMCEDCSKSLRLSPSDFAPDDESRSLEETEFLRQRAIDIYAPIHADDIEFDKGAAVTLATGVGRWVAAWVFVPMEDPD